MDFVSAAVAIAIVMPITVPKQYDLCSFLPLSPFYCASVGTKEHRDVPLSAMTGRKRRLSVWRLASSLLGIVSA